MFDRFALQLGGFHMPGVFVFSAGLLLSLYLMKSYFRGARCELKKDLTNEVAVITGGNTGIGKETARRLVELGCTVIIGARDETKNSETVRQLSGGKGSIKAYKLDLGDKSSIADFTEKVKAEIGERPINYLINNAGVMAIPTKQFTKDGIEMQIGINHFGHFYLTYLLWNPLKSSLNPRVINVSSLAHRNRVKDSEVDLNDLNFEKVEYTGMRAYSRSKKANILFTKELQRRMGEKNIQGISIALHPGVVRTELARNMLDTPLKKFLYTVLSPLTYIFMKSSQQGAQTTLYTILERQDKLEKGGYYADCKPSKILASQCEDEQTARDLWKLSQKIYGIQFDL